MRFQSLLLPILAGLALAARSADLPGGGGAAGVPPQASFQALCDGLTCVFADTSTDPDGSIVSWSWSFGDGSGASLQNPIHTFGGTGTYAVTLTATDDQGKTATTTTALSFKPPSATGAVL